jgi:hypothetical protein
MSLSSCCWTVAHTLTPRTKRLDAQRCCDLRSNLQLSACFACVVAFIAALVHMMTYEQCRAMSRLHTSLAQRTLILHSGAARSTECIPIPCLKQTLLLLLELSYVSTMQDRTPLFEAASAGHANVVEQLLRRGAKRDLMDSEANEPGEEFRDDVPSAVQIQIRNMIQRYSA